MPRTRKREPPSEVKQLSNEELSETLKKHGVDVGPILATTRGVYERKLADIIHRATGAGDEEFEASEEDYMEDDTSGDEEDMMVDDEPEDVPPAMRGYEPIIRQRPQIREDFSTSERTSYSNTSETYRTDMGTRTKDPVPSKVDKAPPKKGFSWLTKLIIFLVLALLVYLVVTNIETIRPKPAALTGDSNV